jgi:PEP-CTERM motif
MRFANQIAVGMLLAAFAAAPLPSAAATISSISIVKNAGNTADFIDNSGNSISAVQSVAAVTASTPTTLDTRYTAVVSADQDGGPPGTTARTFTGDFSITFNVTALAGNSWFLTLDVLRIGAQTIISDGNGNANVALGALTGTETGAGSVTSGSLSLAALTTLDNASSQASSLNSPFSQATNAVISGIGTGAAQTVILNFVFNATASAVDPNGGGTPNADEAALRMGLDSALPGFTADDYPGVGTRNINTDGIWVLFQLDEAPEPGTGLMLGLGLLGLGLRRRVRH